MPYVKTDMSKCENGKAKTSLISCSQTSAFLLVQGKLPVVIEQTSCTLTAYGLTSTMTHQKFGLTTTPPFDII